MKTKGVNWRNWNKLLEFLKTRKPKEINMNPILRVSENCSFMELRKPDRHPCGTVGCIAGWAHVLWGKQEEDDQLHHFFDKTGIDRYSRTGEHVIEGYWADEPQDRLGKREVIRYMTKALKERNVMVKL